MKRFKKGFTLAEVLITLAIIGVVAAISIPSVISNSQQQEFKTGLRKAVSVLNSAITMNMAIDGESPYDNADTYNYLQRHMSIIKSTTRLPFSYLFKGLQSGGNAGSNFGFYTTDGMRFEGEDTCSSVGPVGCRRGPKLQESNIYTCVVSSGIPGDGTCGGCGSYGLTNNPNGTTKPPCIIMVDVNGDRKPTPGNVNCANYQLCGQENIVTFPNPDSKKLIDMFAIMITEDRAVPFGVVAQRAMYQAQAKK